MIICLDFDGTLVEMSGNYADVTTPLRFLPGAKEGVLSLHRAGHMLVLFSARANRALREEPELDPLVMSGARTVNRKVWEEDRELNEKRFQQMIAFVEAELPGVFSAIDSGHQGKPICDLFIDDRAVGLGHGPMAVSWDVIRQVYGEPVFGDLKTGGGYGKKG